ncbi:hypothetical protein Y032_0715g1779 [Ancylostoma ceylanicum]|uniref:Uncharacterized protein n=1 Tax=Ancylostoma ceylanicum TaxID=53326 RepID=A0A016WHH2_9BILA|nr:hypothetical protein Y032_0715g1779 [Ancylostoma ceylanicum]
MRKVMRTCGKTYEVFLRIFKQCLICYAAKGYNFFSECLSQTSVLLPCKHAPQRVLYLKSLFELIRTVGAVGSNLIVLNF